MVARLWVCTEQPMAVGILALPLHPVFILLLVAIGAWWRLMRRQGAATLAFRAASVAFAMLAVVVILFGAISSALLLSGLNPSAALQLAPIAWGAAGLLLWGAAAVYLYKVGWGAVVERLGFPEYAGGGEAGCVWFLVLAVSLSLSAFVVARSFIANEQRLSIPYRLLEWGLVDEIDGIVSDDCLAMRVIEYGRFDAIGRDAMHALGKRSDSSVEGVTAKLDELLEHWPPPAGTITSFGVHWLLDFSERHGGTATVARWKESKHIEDLHKIPPSSISLLW